MQSLIQTHPSNQVSPEFSAESICRVWGSLSYEYRNLYADVIGGDREPQAEPEGICRYPNLVPVD
jgi:hypothetical protein